MAILKKGIYKGKYKEGNEVYHMFTPESVAFNGDIKYYRIGDYTEEFPTDRNYSLLIPNEEEQILIQKANEVI